MKKLVLTLALLVTLGGISVAQAGVSVNLGFGFGGPGYYAPYYGPYYGPPGGYYGPGGPLVYIGAGYYPWYRGYWHGGYCYRGFYRGGYGHYRGYGYYRR